MREQKEEPAWLNHSDQKEASGKIGIGRQQQGPHVGSWAPFKGLQWKRVTSRHNGDYC